MMKNQKDRIDDQYTNSNNRINNKGATMITAEKLFTCQDTTNNV